MSDEPEPIDALEWFGRELAAALVHKGATQRELSDFTGYKQPYVSKVKNGQALPSPLFSVRGSLRPVLQHQRLLRATTAARCPTGLPDLVRAVPPARTASRDHP
jgi:hypothetical protein